MSTIKNQIDLNGKSAVPAGSHEKFLFNFEPEHIDNLEASRLIIVSDHVFTDDFKVELNGVPSVVVDTPDGYKAAYFPRFAVQTKNAVILRNKGGKDVSFTELEFQLSSPDEQQEELTLKVKDTTGLIEQVVEIFELGLEAAHKLTPVEIDQKVIVTLEPKVSEFGEADEVIIDEPDEIIDPIPDPIIDPIPDPIPVPVPPIKSFPWVKLGGFDGNRTPGQPFISDKDNATGNGWNLVDVAKRQYLTFKKNPEMDGKILNWDLKDDPDKGRYLSTHIDLKETTPNLYVYRAQTSAVFDFTKKPKAYALRTKDVLFKGQVLEELGWDDDYVGEQDELIQTWSMRIPQSQSLNFASVGIHQSWDDPVSLQVWQNRHRFLGPYEDENGNKVKGNVPISIYWRGDHLAVKNQFDDRQLIPNVKANGAVIAQVRKGHWAEFLIRLVQGTTDGKVVIYMRWDDEETFREVYSYEGMFYGRVDEKFRPSFIDVPRAMGLPAVGLYTSSRLSYNNAQKMIKNGVDTLEVHHTEMKVLRFKKGQTPMLEIKSSLEGNPVHLPDPIDPDPIDPDPGPTPDPTPIPTPIPPGNENIGFKTIRENVNRWSRKMKKSNFSVQQLLDKQRVDGSLEGLVPNIDTMRRHIHTMALALNFDEKWIGNEKLEIATIRALNWWRKDPVYPSNWTPKKFQMPRHMGMVLCLLYDAMKKHASLGDTQQLIAHAKTLHDFVFDGLDAGDALGSNLAARLRAGVSLSAWEESEPKFTQTVKYIEMCLEVGAGKETQFDEDYWHTGLAVDGSFHQHNKPGPQMIWGNYGEVFMSEVALTVEYLSGSAYNLSQDQYDIIYNALVDGQAWFMYKDRTSPFVRGRQAFVPKDTSFARGTLDLLVRHGNFNDEQKAKLQSMVRDYKDGNPTDGHKAFYASDMLVVSERDYNFVLKMMSKFSSGLEQGLPHEFSTNTYFMGAGGYEIVYNGDDDIWEVANFNAVPGTTAEQKPGWPTFAGTPNYKANSDFAGVVSDGEENSVASFWLDRNDTVVVDSKKKLYPNLNALKSYFVTDGIITCLGAGIARKRGGDAPIWTCVDQRKLNGQVLAFINGLEYNLSQGVKQYSILQPSWIWHDNTLYHFPEPCNIELRAEFRNGSLKRAYSKGSDKNVSVGVFQLVIDNSMHDSYAYTIIPMIERSTFESASVGYLPEIVANSASFQQIKFAENLLTVNRSNVEMSEGIEYIGQSLSIYNTETGKGFASDPLKNQQGATIDGIDFEFAQGIYKGKTTKF